MMRKLMRSFVRDGEYHDSFFSFAIANIAETGLFFLEIASAAISASMATFLYFLAMLMDADVALGTIMDGVVHF